MVDWIAVLRAAANRLASVGAESAASAGVALLHALDAAADELERQRDAAQGAATVPDTSAREGAQEDRCAQPPPAPICNQHLHHDSLKDGRCELPAGHTGFCSNGAFPYQPVAAHGTEEAAKTRQPLAVASDTAHSAPASSSADFARVVLAERDKYRDDAAAWQGASRDRTAECDALRARLAEREVELEELIWALKRMGWYASDRADGTAEQRLASAGKCAADFLAAHERARRAKEKL